MTLDTLLMLKVVRADDNRAQLSPCLLGRVRSCLRENFGYFALKREANMKLIVRTCLTACVTLTTLMAAQITSAQSVISDSDVARLRAFISENDFEGQTPSGMGASVYSSSVGSVVNGVYKVQPGDTLSEIMACIWATQVSTTTLCKK